LADGRRGPDTRRTRDRARSVLGAGPWDPRPVADAIEMGIARFAEHGVDVETCLFGLDGSDDVEAVVGAALRARRGRLSLSLSLSAAAVCGSPKSSLSCSRRWSIWSGDTLPMRRSRSTRPQPIPSTGPLAGEGSAYEDDGHHPAVSDAPLSVAATRSSSEKLQRPSSKTGRGALKCCRRSTPPRWRAVRRAALP